MEVSISQQALGLLCFSALGLGLGLLYDLLRLPRYRLRREIIWDGLFCALAAAACFTLAIGRGKFGIWEILLCLGFFCLYINYISARVFPIISRFFRLFSAFVQFLEKTYFFAKKFFSNESN